MPRLENILSEYGVNHYSEDKRVDYKRQTALYKGGLSPNKTYSFGNDKEYISRLYRLMLSYELDTFFFTADGTEKYMLNGGLTDGVFATANFGSDPEGNFEALDARRPNQPHVCMEYWCGWFDHWGEKPHKRDAEDIVAPLKRMQERGEHFNIYMFHGGTNFGFMNGFNLGRYWNIGPALDLYIPAPLIKKGKNEIVVFETERFERDYITANDYRTKREEEK